MGDYRIFITKISPRPTNFEFVERKGLGHPDTLSDVLAESLSREYSNYTKSKFGAVLHHNFDKVGLLGGQSFVMFGKGYLTKPIRVLINGRASTRFGNQFIPVKEIIEKTVHNFFSAHFPNLDLSKDIEMHFNLSNASSPGKTDEKNSEKGTRRYWFEPRGLHDLKELKYLASNDTSLGCSYAPLSIVENIVLQVESMLNNVSYKSSRPWLGSDIKIMASRVENEINLTICIPQIADFVPNQEAYQNNLKNVNGDITNLVEKLYPEISFSLYINTRDDFETSELYLTAIGSSIESGDEGLVGRGNRINGLITPCRPMSIEGACGKNPVYHVGKIYNIAAKNIAQKIYEKTGLYTEVYLVSQSGKELTEPWKTIIAIAGDEYKEKEIKEIVTSELERMPLITNNILKGEVQLF